jgi:hypothetical protein
MVYELSPKLKTAPPAPDVRGNDPPRSTSGKYESLRPIQVRMQRARDRQVMYSTVSFTKSLCPSLRDFFLLAASSSVWDCRLIRRRRKMLAEDVNLPARWSSRQGLNLAFTLSANFCRPPCWPCDSRAGRRTSDVLRCRSFKIITSSSKSSGNFPPNTTQHCTATDC